MLQLNVNPTVLKQFEAVLPVNQESLAYLAGELQRSCTAETSLYVNTPPADADLSTIQQKGQGKSAYGEMVHPHMIAQMLANMAAKLGTSVPDNLLVFVGNDWHQAHTVQAVIEAPKPAVPTIPAAPPAPLQELVTREVQGAQITMPAVTAQQIDAARAAQLDVPPLLGTLDGVAAPAPAATPAPVAAAAPAPAAAAPAPTPTPEAVGTVEFGLPAPLMTNVGKARNPLDADPGGKPSTTAPERLVRDMVSMLPDLFAKPAVAIIRGDGKGVAQRARAYTTVLQLIDMALAGVPDATCSVGYLRHHIAHLRYNASQTAAGATMLDFERNFFERVAAGSTKDD